MAIEVDTFVRCALDADIVDAVERKLATNPPREVFVGWLLEQGVQMLIVQRRNCRLKPRAQFLHFTARKRAPTIGQRDSNVG